MNNEKNEENEKEGKKTKIHLKKKKKHYNM